MTRRQKRLLLRIVLGAALFAAGLFLDGWWHAGHMIGAWLVSGYNIM